MDEEDGPTVNVCRGGILSDDDGPVVSAPFCSIDCGGIGAAAAGGGKTEDWSRSRSDWSAAHCGELSGVGRVEDSSEELDGVGDGGAESLPLSL